VSLVYVKNKKNKTTYVYESTAYWDKEKQQSRNTRVCIGKLVDNVFVPNKQYRMQKELEQLRQGMPGASLPSESIRKFYGATYLLDRIGELHGISEDLQRCFPDSSNQMLSLVYFLILEENNTISRFPRWAATHLLPYGGPIPTQRCSELFQLVTEEAKQQFFQLQVARRNEQDYLAFDISTISSFSETLNQVKYRNDKQSDPMAEINLCLMSGERSNMPVGYRRLPRSLSDLPMIKGVLRDLEDLITGKVKLVLDYDFYSEGHINDLYTNHYKFLMGAPVSSPFIQQHLEAVRDTIRTRAHYHTGHKIGCYSVMSVWPHERVKKRTSEVIKADKRIYVHLYYDERLAIDDKVAFNKRLDQLEQELYANKRVSAHEHLYERYFHLRQTHPRRIAITLRQDALDAQQRDFGHFALISNDIKAPVEALEVYRSRTLIEDAFGNLKERLNMRGTLVSYEQNLEGKLFVQFVAHMYVAAIDKTMREKELYATHTMTSLLDQLDMLEQYRSDDHSPYLGEITEDQKELYARFGFEAPHLPS